MMLSKIIVNQKSPIHLENIHFRVFFISAVWKSQNLYFIVNRILSFKFAQAVIQTQVCLIKIKEVRNT